jgi:hypothetical protein
VKPPGLELVERISSQIFEYWEKMREEHPEEDDLVAIIEPHGDGTEHVALSIATRRDFVEFMRDSGRWVGGSTWDRMLKPAGGETMPRASAIWVVVHGEGESAIMRLVNGGEAPWLVSQGGSA